MLTSVARLEKFKLDILIVLVYVFFMLFVAVAVEDMLIANFFHDDSFYYIKTAENLGRSGFASFDGINPTNGYHPLYLWVLVLLSKFHQLVGFAGIRPIIVLHAVLVSGAVLSVISIMSKCGISLFWRMLAVVSTLGAVGFVDVGVEAALFLMCVWSLVALLVKASPLASAKWTERALITAFACLVCLARTDAILLIFFFLVPPILQTNESRARWLELRQVATTIVLPSIMVFTLYSGYNYYGHGHLQSVSASLKVHWPGTFATGWLWQSILGIKARFFIVVSVSIVFLSLILERRVKYGFDMNVLRVTSLMVAMNLWSLVYCAILMFFAAGGIAQWYFSLPLSISVLTICFTGFLLWDKAQRSMSLSSKTVSVLALLLTAAALVFYVSRRFTLPQRGPQLAVAAFLREKIPVGQRVYQVDGGGFVAYFSDRPLINGDGLINSWEYQRFVKEKRVVEYLSEKEVRWIVTDRLPSDDGNVVLAVPRWDGTEDTVGYFNIAHSLFTADRFAVFPLTEMKFRRH
jgi:hypothetical protein